MLKSLCASVVNHRWLCYQTLCLCCEHPQASYKEKQRGEKINHKEADSEAEKIRINEITGEIIGAAIEVHGVLGPGLLESAYEECFCHELCLRNVAFERQVPLPMEYKGLKLDCGYRLDLVVENLVIVELKSVNKIDPIHEAQLLTYLRLRNSWVGLVINFNVAVLKNGIKRIVNGYVGES